LNFLLAPWASSLFVPSSQFGVSLSSLSDQEHGADAGADGRVEEASVSLPRGPIKLLLHLRAFEALQYRQYRLLWYGQVFASMGTWMDQVTRGWLIYELTNSTLQLGMVRGIQAIPYLLLSPLAGSTADRYSRKFQVVASQFANGLLYASMALMIFSHSIRPWHVYVNAFLMAVVQVFLQPSRGAMISDTVPRSKVTNAIGLNAVVFNMARSTGPALSGLLISWSGTGFAYVVQALFFLLATVWTVQLSSTWQDRNSVGADMRPRESIGRSILEGWKFSWRRDEVRTGLLVTVAASLFMLPFSTMLPVFARDRLAVGAQGQGLLLTGMGIGALCSSFLIAGIGDRLPRGILMCAGAALYGILVALFSASPWFGVSVALMTVIGLCHVASQALVQTVIQTYSPPEFRGRTTSIYNQTQVVFLLGGMLIGALSSVIGAPWAAALLGLTGSLTVTVIFFMNPAAREIR
jgi:MFS family permease